MNKKLALYLCNIIITLFAVVLTINSPLLSYMAGTFHLNMAQSGAIFTANFIGFAIFIFIGGILADKLNKKIIISIALIGLSLSVLVFPFSPNIYVAIIIMLFIGGFGGVIEGNINALVAEIYPEKAEFYINSSQVFFGLGALFGPIITGALVASGISWQTCYFGLGILVALTAILFSLSKLDITIYDDKITLKIFKSLISNKKFLLICLCMFLYTGSEVGGWGWLSTFLKGNLQFSSFKASVAVGIFWLSMTVGRFICGMLTDKFTSRSMVIVLSFASAIITILAGAISNRYFVWLIFVFMGLSYSSLWPLIVAYGNRFFSKTKGTVFALFIGSGGVGGSLIPLFIGIIAQNINIRIGIMSPAIFMFLISFIFLSFKES